VFPTNGSKDERPPPLLKGSWTWRVDDSPVGMVGS